MRIVMFTPGLDAASLGALVHQDFATTVEGRGHRFRIVTTARPGMAAGSTAIGMVLPTSSLWRLGDRLAAPWLRTRSILSPAGALSRHLKTAGDDIDLLHVEMAYPFGTAAAIAARASGWTGPLAITPMGEDTLMLEECHYGFRRYAVPRRLVAWTLRQATGLRCISPLHERFIAALAPETPRRVIPLNVSQAFVAAAHESPEARAGRRRDAREAVDAEFQTAGRPLVLSLGRLHPFKGIDVLIGAMRQVPDATLLIAGPSLHLPTGDEGSRLRRLVERWDLGTRTRFLGPVPSGRALQLLAAASAVAVPSRLESLNKVCVEAAAVGTPFVVTETTGISAWAHDFEGASVVPAGDEAAFADGLRRVIDRSRPADAGQTRRFVDQFSPGTVAAAVLDFYQDLTRTRDA